jgi:alkylation response protein AidB-like acyl-CoA dehydrogenase
VGGALVIAVANASDAQIATFPSVDETRRLSEVKLAGIRGRVIAVGDGAQRALERALLDSLAVLACEQSGIVDAAFDLALDYVKERRQFGRTIGSFQAIKHRLAEAWIVGNQLRAAALSAVRSVDAADAGTLSRTDAAIAVRTASAYAKAHTSRIVEEVLQFHGGNGMTWEFPVHLLLKRAKLDEVAAGGADAQRDELGRLIDI